MVVTHLGLELNECNFGQLHKRDLNFVAVVHFQIFHHPARQEGLIRVGARVFQNTAVRGVHRVGAVDAENGGVRQFIVAHAHQIAENVAVEPGQM